MADRRLVMVTSGRGWTASCPSESPEVGRDGLVDWLSQEAAHSHYSALNALFREKELGKRFGDARRVLLDIPVIGCGQNLRRRIGTVVASP